MLSRLFTRMVSHVKSAQGSTLWAAFAVIDAQLTELERRGRVIEELHQENSKLRDELALLRDRCASLENGLEEREGCQALVIAMGQELRQDLEPGRQSDEWARVSRYYLERFHEVFDEGSADSPVVDIERQVRAVVIESVGMGRDIQGIGGADVIEPGRVRREKGGAK